MDVKERVIGYLNLLLPIIYDSFDKSLYELFNQYKVLDLSAYKYDKIPNVVNVSKEEGVEILIPKTFPHLSLVFHLGNFSSDIIIRPSLSIRQSGKEFGHPRSFVYTIEEMENKVKKFDPKQITDAYVVILRNEYLRTYNVGLQSRMSYHEQWGHH